jgi:hypothetical protein
MPNPNLQLQADLLPWVSLCHDVIEVTDWKGHTDNGAAVLDPTTTRQYRCYIQNNDRTSWNEYAATDGMPYISYTLSIPIGQTDAVPIRSKSQMTVITSNLVETGTIRRIGVIKSYPDQYGNLHNMAITFE